MSAKCHLLQQSQSYVSCLDSLVACDDNKSPSLDDDASSDVQAKMPDMEVLVSVDDQDDKLLLLQHGYTKTRQICDTMQGEMFCAEIISGDIVQSAASRDQQQGFMNLVGNFKSRSRKRVTIKRSCKELVQNKLGIEDGFSMVVDHDITKEIALLHHITVDNTAIGGYISEFVNGFESPSNYYLVYENVGSCDLLDFADTGHRYMSERKISLKEWQKVTKFVMWQLSVTLNWLHCDMSICHLNLSMKNIMVRHANWDGSRMCDKLTVKICDFGLAEIFRTNDNQNNSDQSEAFKCYKLINDQYKSPQVFDSDLCEFEMFDARKADTWELGVLFYRMCCGQYPYQVARKTDAGYTAIKHRKLQHYVHNIGLSHYFNKKIFSLLYGLLHFHEKGRFLMPQVLRHEYVKQYYQKYGARICSKSKQQKKKNQRQPKQASLPYYTPNKPKYSV